MDFHLDKGGGVFQADEDSLANDILYIAYKIWQTEFEKRPGLNPDGLLRRVMDDDLTWNYDRSFELRGLLKSVLENAMANHDSVAEYAREVSAKGGSQIVLKYADGSPMKPADISLLMWFHESGAFDSVED